MAHLSPPAYRIEDHGGILVKPLANFQFDLALAHGIVDTAYLDACQDLAKDLPASLVCRPFSLSARPPTRSYVYDKRPTEQTCSSQS